MLSKEWIFNNITDEYANELSRKAGISSLLAKVFLNRGIDDVDYIKRFLSPSMGDMYDPFLLKDMEKAVERIVRAVDDREKIVIYGDYDVDGITSTSVLVNFLLAQGAFVDFYIPDRIDEGYGLSRVAIDNVIKMGASLIITVDCGITAVDEVRYIKENNIDIIVTDHHQCKDELPEGYAVINPCRPDCEYPFKQLAGIGVAYKLVQAMCIRLGLEDEHEKYLDLVALGTVADVVPLLNENRIIVKYGISRIEKTRNLGLRALIDNSGLKDKAVNSFGISFILAPRVNAAGRIGDAGRAVKLFTTDDEKEALSIALELNEENKYRQDTEAVIFQEVLASVESNVDLEREKVIVVHGEGWHHGIIGIVASKVTERYYRPCILINVEDGTGKASGRSIEGFNLFNALNYCSTLLEKFGGHELAAGLSLKFENIQEFRRMINQYADSILEEHQLVPKLKIDVNINKYDISLDNIKELDLLAPFGAGNPGPLFAYNGLKLNDIRTVGENKHIKLRLEDKGFLVDAIGFNMGSMSNVLKNNDSYDCAFSLEINTWNSSERVQLNLKDMKQSADRVYEDLYFSSLDSSLELQYLNKCTSWEEQARGFNLESSEDSFISKLGDFVKEGLKAAVLVNTLQSLRELDNLLKNSIPGIKKAYRICYTESNGQDAGSICIIVNPKPGVVRLNTFEKVLFYGTWISGNYLRYILNEIEPEKVGFYITPKYDPFLDEIVPEREDMAVVYQFIRESLRLNPLLKNGFLAEDLFFLADKIAQSYKVNMNYFKLKKCIEIFEELNLVKLELSGPRGISIVLNETFKGKANLEDSSLYKGLQALKAQARFTNK